MTAAADPGTEEWESLCRRCGTSCHFAVRVGTRAVVVDDVHCRFLESDGAVFRCSVYERRHELAPWCKSAEEALREGLLAQDCPYARGLLGYVGKTRVHRRLVEQVEAAARAVLLAEGAPIGASIEGLQRLFARSGHPPLTWTPSPDGKRLLATPAER